jgi:hypothetical protein
LISNTPAQSAEQVALPHTSTRQTNLIIKNILLDEVQLGKFNLYYRREATKQGRWKGLRYFAFEESNASLTESGLIVTVAERMSHIHGKQFENLHTGALMHANVLAGIGQILGASGSIEEFLINGYHSVVASRMGYSPGQAMHHASELLKRIDSGLSELNREIEAERIEERVAAFELHQKEARVLTDIRDLLVIGFDGFHIRSRRMLWFQQSFYVLDVAREATGSLGNLFGYKALHQRNRKFNQPAGVLVTVSGALIMLNPILARLYGKAVGSFDEYLLKKCGLGQDKVDVATSKLQSDSNELIAACDAYKESDERSVIETIKRVDLYAMHRVDQQLEINSRDFIAGRRQAVQNLFSGIFVGSTKLANGIEFDVAGFKYANNPRMTNVMLGTGSIPSVAGAAYAVAQNARIQLMAERNRYQSAKKGELTDQIIRTQIDQLDKLEKAVNLL